MRETGAQRPGAGVRAGCPRSSPAPPGAASRAVCVAGADIHVFRIGARTPAAGATPVPLVLTHGRPSSFFEFLPLIGPLTDPVRTRRRSRRRVRTSSFRHCPVSGSQHRCPAGRTIPRASLTSGPSSWTRSLQPAVDLPGRLQQTGALQRGQGQQQPGQRRGEYGSSGNLRPGRQLTIEATVNPSDRLAPARGTAWSSPGRPPAGAPVPHRDGAAGAGTAPTAAAAPGVSPDAVALTLLHPRHARRSLRSGYRGRSGRYGRSGQPGLPGSSPEAGSSVKMGRARQNGQNRAPPHGTTLTIPGFAAHRSRKTGHRGRTPARRPRRAAPTGPAPAPRPGAPDRAAPAAAHPRPPPRRPADQPASISQAVGSMSYEESWGWNHGRSE